MNTDNFLIEAKIIENAKNLCKLISDTDVRNRAVANSFAASIAEKFFDKDKYNVDTESGLHNIDFVLNEMDISDIYINNNYIDVRICFPNNELTIPQKHFSTGILPFAYMFIEVATNLSEASVLGFILTGSVDRNRFNGSDIIIDKGKLVDFDSVACLMETPISDNIDAIEVYNFVDGKVSDKDAFYQKLILSKESRIKLARAVKAKNIFNFISVTPIEDNTVLINELNENNSGIKELEPQISSYEYPTEIEPSSSSSKFELSEDDLNDSELFEKDAVQNEGYQNEKITVSEEEDIDKLFHNAEQSESESNSEFDNSGYDENFRIPKKKTNILLLILVVVLILAGTGAYFFFNQQNLPTAENLSNDKLNNDRSNQNMPVAKVADVMPIETVEKDELPQINNEGVSAVSMPSIEKNLDASILVSNLKIEWEVPQGYVSNISTKKYFEKLGKIIQLNLKTELLLLSKPPITNKIAVELQYNKAENRFEATGIAISSGEKRVDDLILRTINSALATKLSMSTTSFADIQGAPLLIIHL